MFIIAKIATGNGALIAWLQNFARVEEEISVCLAREELFQSSWRN